MRRVAADTDCLLGGIDAAEKEDGTLDGAGVTSGLVSVVCFCFWFTPMKETGGGY